MLNTKLISLALLLLPFCLSAQQVDAGNGHAIILDDHGRVWTVGRNDHGQIGDSTLQNRPVPTLVKGLPPIKVISRGYDHSLALDSTGTIWSWGLNNYGQLGSSILRDQTTPYQLSYHTGFVAIEGGHWHTVAIHKDSSVWAWGHNFYGELGNLNREHSQYPNGVYARTWEDSTPRPLRRITRIACVGYHTLALDADGRVWTWGSNDFNELGYQSGSIQNYAMPVPGIPPMQDVAVGWHHSVALDRNGNVWAWGSDPSKQYKESTVKFYAKPFRVPGLPPIRSIACGSWHTLALDAQGKVWGWGKNHFGMLGKGDSTSTSVPVRIPALNDITQVGGGCFQSLAVDRQGKIWTFGDNPSGQLGINSCERSHIPRQMLVDIHGNLDAPAPQAQQPEDSAEPGQAAIQTAEMPWKQMLWGTSALLLISFIANILLLRKRRRIV